MRMVFQHDVPVRSKAYYFKPALNTTYLRFNMEDTKFVKDKNGFYKAAMENIPALKEEPQMPPEDEVRSWLLLYYTRENRKTANASDFWSRAGGAIVHNWQIKDTLKPGKEMKAAAASIAAASSSAKANDRLFNAAGRLRVTQSAGPRCSTRMYS